MADFEPPMPPEGVPRNPPPPPTGGGAPLPPPPPPGGSAPPPPPAPGAAAAPLPGAPPPPPSGGFAAPPPPGSGFAPQAGQPFGSPPASQPNIAGYATNDFSSGNIKTADPARRLLARLIDIVIWFPVYFILSLVIGVAGSTSDTAGAAASVGGAFLMIGWAILYDVVPMALKGQTVGKMALGLKAVGPNGESPLGWPLAFKRWILTAVVVIPLLGIVVHFIVGAVSTVLLFSDDRSRTVHDMIGGTLVVDA